MFKKILDMGDQSYHLCRKIKPIYTRNTKIYYFKSQLQTQMIGKQLNLVPLAVKYSIQPFYDFQSQGTSFIFPKVIASLKWYNQ